MVTNLRNTEDIEQTSSLWATGVYMWTGFIHTHDLTQFDPFYTSGF